MDPVQFITNLYANLETCNISQDLRNKLSAGSELTNNDALQIAKKVLIKESDNTITFINKKRTFFLFRPFVYLYKCCFGETTKAQTNYSNAIQSVRQAVNELKDLDLDEATKAKTSSLVKILNQIIQKIGEGDAPIEIVQRNVQVSHKPSAAISAVVDKILIPEPVIEQEIVPQPIIEQEIVAEEVVENVLIPQPVIVEEIEVEDVDVGIEVEKADVEDVVEDVVEEVEMEEPTQLQKACFGGDLDAVRELLASGDNVNEPNSHGTTPLHYACSQGNLEIVEELLKHDADVNSKDKDDVTPLHTACQNFNVEIIKLLIEKDADINAVDNEGNTPLYYAWQEGDIDSVEELLSHDAQLGPRETPLHDAIEEELDIERIVELIKNNPELVYSVDDKGNTPLNFACKLGNLDAVTVLLENEADPDYWNVHGDTPLHTAVKNNTSIEIIKALINHKASLDSQNNDGDTPLHFAYDADEDVLQELIKKSQLDVTNRRGETPLHIFIESGNTNGATMLIRAGAQINAQNIRGETPLHYACMGDNEIAANELLKNVVTLNINCQDELGATPLHYAYKNGNKEIIKSLIKLGANTDIQDKTGKTPQEYAVTNIRNDFMKTKLSPYAEHYLPTLEADLNKLKDESQYFQNTNPFGEFLFNITPTAKALFDAIQNFNPRNILESTNIKNHDHLIKEFKDSLKDLQEGFETLKELQKSLPPGFKTLLENNPNKSLPDLMAKNAFISFQQSEQLIQGNFDTLWDKIKPGKGEADRTKETFNAYKAGFNFLAKTKDYWKKLYITQNELTAPKYLNNPAMLKLALSQFKEDFIKCISYDKQIGTKQVGDFSEILMRENNKTNVRGYSKHLIRESLINNLDRRELKSNLDGQESRYDTTIAGPRTVVNKFEQLQQERARIEPDQEPIDV